MKFHEKLYAVRKKAGMTQNDLAEKLNVSRQAVSRWEMGTAMPDVDNLVAMSDLFEVSLDYLLKDNPMPVKEANDSVASQQDEKPNQKASWLLIPIVMPLVGLSLLLNGWLFEKDTLFDIGFFLISISLVVLIVGIIAMLVYSCFIHFRNKNKE